MVDNTYTCTLFPCLLVYCDLHGWLHQVPIYWKWPLPSPYIFLILLLSPEVHPHPSNHPARIITRLRIIASVQQRPGPCSSSWKTAKINVSSTHNTRLSIYAACRYASRILQSIPSYVHVLTTPNFA